MRVIFRRAVDLDRDQFTLRHLALGGQTMGESAVVSGASPFDRALTTVRPYLVDDHLLARAGLLLQALRRDLGLLLPWKSDASACPSPRARHGHQAHWSAGPPARI